MAKEENKITLEEYQKKYNKPYNEKAVSSFLIIFSASIGIIIASCLFFMVMKLFEIHNIAGYVGIGVAVIIFIFAYIIPLVKIASTKSFITNVNGNVSAKKAQKYNKELRLELADKIIDLNEKTKDVSWYKEESVNKIAKARLIKDDKMLKEELRNIYKTDVKNSCNSLIRDHALKIGLATAISQSERVDTLFVCAYDLTLIKDIIYLYGFRPNDRDLAKIYKSVIVDAVIAYGLSSVTSNIAQGVVGKIGKAAGGVPVLGGVIGTVIDSVTQGMVNASLTVLIGMQTKKYLMKEYKLADILDEVIITDEEVEKEEALMIEDLKSDIKEKSKKKELKVA